MMWTLWWVWVAGALVLAILEVLVPGFILLGFAIGAAIVGLLFGIGGPIADWMSANIPGTLVIFALLSVLAWFCLRRIVGIRKSQVKIWHRDINED
ncbi:MAG: NfeD family protein [Halocynthiibacter sp.]